MPELLKKCCDALKLTAQWSSNFMAFPIFYSFKSWCHSCKNAYLFWVMTKYCYSLSIH